MRFPRTNLSHEIHLKPFPPLDSLTNTFCVHNSIYFLKIGYTDALGADFNNFYKHLDVSKE